MEQRLKELLDSSMKADSSKTRMGMIYAILAGPALGLALGLLGLMVGKAPFNLEYPTGGWAIVEVFQIPFALLAFVVFALCIGNWREIGRIWTSRIAWWTLFTGTGGFLGDICYACSVVLIGGAVAGPIGGLYGLVGAVIVSSLYKENIKRWSTLVGLVLTSIGIWIVLGGASLVSPTHGIYMLVGVLIIIGATLTWGMENFSIAAGTDLMAPETVLFYRLLFTLVIGSILLYVLFPVSRHMAALAFADPKLVTFGAVIGFSWIIWMLMGYYMGIAYAGGVRGGVLAGTFGFFFIAFFSMTIYNVPFSYTVIFGSILLFAGAALFVTEPKELLASKRN
jgi:drug/metabolite transporter (DMT)-like permease